MIIFKMDANAQTLGCVHFGSGRGGHGADQGSIVEVFTDLSVWAGIRKVIERVNANAIAAS